MKGSQSSQELSSVLNRILSKPDAISSAVIDKVTEIFYLSEGEKHFLLSADIGEGLFFAGPNHVAMRVVASPEEHRLITSKPEELLKIKAEKKKAKEEESFT